MTSQEKMMLSLKEARERRVRVGFKPSDINKPAFLGVRKVEVALEELVPFIDGKGLSDVGRSLLDTIVQDKLLQARGVYGFWPALSIGDDIVLYRAESLREEIARFPMLRQQSGEHTTSLADFVAPKQSGLTDYLGAFAVTAGLGADELARDHESADLIKDLAARLTEAFAESLHARARKDLGHDDTTHRGIRTAFGSPACPDPTDKRALFTILGAREIGMELTDELAVRPAASVSGLYIAHPKAHDFDVGPLTRDQLEDYATRKGTTVHEVERWLRANLAHDPA